MTKVLVAFGTRPEAIKMAPVIKELQCREEVECIICTTGQHREMLDQVLRVFNIEPHYNLSVMKEQQTLFDMTISILDKIKVVLEEERPDMVLVHGDTTTTFAVSLACFYLKIAIGHIEAGLRTYNIYSPYPEEFNRQATSVIAKIHFAPTVLAYKNLLAEGKSKTEVYITGNTVIDALKTTVYKGYSHVELEWAQNSKLVLLTAHRRENIGDPLRQMFRAIRKVVDEHPDIKVVYPLHKNPEIRNIAHELLGDHIRIHMIEPLDVIDFHNFMARSYLILTDSGGIQEEAPTFGIPVLVMRNETERPEGIEAGVLKLVGTKESDIYNAFTCLLNDPQVYASMSASVNPFGDGFASKRIVNIVVDKAKGTL